MRDKARHTASGYFAESIVSIYSCDIGVFYAQVLNRAPKYMPEQT